MALTHLPLRRSVLLGVAAYLLGYLPAYLVAAANRAAVSLPAAGGRTACSG